MHPNETGKNVSSKSYIQEILKTKNGIVSYTSINKDAKGSGEKTTVYKTYDVLGIVLGAVFALFHFIWTRTRFRSSVVCNCGNQTAAYVSGISVNKVKIWAYVVSGVLSALAGWLLSGYMGAVTASMGAQYEMQVIAAAVD